MQIMDGIQAQAKYLVAHQKVAQVGPRESLAGVAGATVLDGPRIISVDGVAQVQPSPEGKHCTVAREPGGQHTIKDVNASSYALQKAIG